MTTEIEGLINDPGQDEVYSQLMQRLDMLHDFAPKEKLDWLINVIGYLNKRIVKEKMLNNDYALFVKLRDRVTDMVVEATNEYTK